MGCCGVATTEDKRTPNQRYNSNQYQLLNQTQNTRNKNNQNSQSNSINVFKVPLKNTDEIPNKIGQESNTNENIISVNSPQQIQVSQRKTTIRSKETIKSYKGIKILDNVKEYLPDDVTRDEIEEMVMGAIGDNVVDQNHFKKGVNLTRGHVEALIDIIYMTLVGRNNGDKNYEEMLGDIKLKVGFCDVNSESVKNIMFKGQNPTEGEIEQVLEQFKSSINPKLFVIELLD